LLSAVCYRESAQSALERTGSALLPPIGFYYALYHAALAAGLYDQTGEALAGIVDFVKQVSEQSRLEPRVVDRIAITIGDDIGDDVFHMYLSDEDRERVVGYLVAQGLST
jgi:hypothetical protein